MFECRVNRKHWGFSDSCVQNCKDNVRTLSHAPRCNVPRVERHVFIVCSQTAQHVCSWPSLHGAEQRHRALSLSLYAQKNAKSIRRPSQAAKTHRHALCGDHPARKLTDLTARLARRISDLRRSKRASTRHAGRWRVMQKPRHGGARRWGWMTRTPWPPLHQTAGG